MPKVTLVPKDSVNQKFDMEVETWYHSHGAFTFAFADGSTRTYPAEHVWCVAQETAHA